MYICLLTYYICTSICMSLYIYIHVYMYVILHSDFRDKGDNKLKTCLAFLICTYNIFKQ